ncbi:hypothetical protein ElyMa_003819400 [Elysia marginata]|uniref:Fibronectin type-II domain-containing protein n=1 Tax=Elysia marginata TaxID=1093978 RepID=A0AAV4FF50_9GAST|nr:hypothetical protein ElyMa_003819400 [Elysia marginata]
MHFYKIRGKEVVCLEGNETMGKGWGQCRKYASYKRGWRCLSVAFTLTRLTSVDDEDNDNDDDNGGDDDDKDDG